MFRIAAISAVITSVFMYFIYYPGWQSVAAGAGIGFFSPVLISVYTETIFRRFLIRANLLVMLVVNTLAHLLIIFGLAIFFVSIFYVGGDFKYMLSDPNNIFNSFFLIGISFGMFLSLAFNFFNILDTLIGKNILGKFFIGIYRQPREVDRVFMFLDVKSSTSIAEKIGHLDFMSMMNDFFYDMTAPVYQTKGEIYKYVGDEAIITWKPKHAFKNANCIWCFLNIREVINSKSDYYLNKYGMVPEFKAGMHCGLAVTGELGYTKREIAYMGDVLNTTARIQEACKSYGKSLLISEAILERIPGKNRFNFSGVGEVTLRGKVTGINLYGFENADS